MKEVLVRLIPDLLKPIFKRICHLPMDVHEGLKDRSTIIPPKRVTRGSGSCFKQIGHEFKDYFVDLANLQPNHRVLDIGCGIGRMAIPLTGYLSSEGGYWGFDVRRSDINWCQKHISPLFPNFHFLHSNVYNKHYNRRGKLRGHNFEFPFDDSFFDFVFLTSVFTHKLPLDVTNYISEISRVLKIGSKALITFFILNEESRNLIQAGSSTRDFKYKVQDCLIIKKNDPEYAVAYDEEYVIKLLGEYGLKVIQPIHYGSWCNRDNFVSYQDMLIVTKSHSN